MQRLLAPLRADAAAAGHGQAAAEECSMWLTGGLRHLSMSI